MPSAPPSAAAASRAQTDRSGACVREINWDGVPAMFSDPSGLPGDFFNVNSPRGAVFSTPGTAFMVSANAGGAAATLFGFPDDFEAFSAQKIFTAVNSPITDVLFFEPGTTNAATTNAFGVVFVDVEAANVTKLEFFDVSNNLIYTRNALVSGNQGLTFLGAAATAGERIGRVRITAGANTFVSNGVLGNLDDEIVVMDDFLYGEPVGRAAVPEPGLTSLVVLGGIGALRRWRRSRQGA